ncbi:YdaU family protein [Achromobacter xylosoxidans]|uniref:YdaU family protein n=1 Tax=Alcaligenes xylosoxydans xylosoxydans TaxID=85698 RepID=UPI0005F94A29|nr:YdaU family protein [Achromobacter xylosoxidans]
MNYYPHHIGDFNSATRHLTRLERSVYRDMLDLYYDTEAPLTPDMDVLCRLLIARSNEERTAVEQVLNEFFTETEEGWRHSRCDSEIEKYHAQREAKSAAGKASAAKRAQKSQRPLSSRSAPVEQPNHDCATNQNQNQNQEKNIPPTPRKRGQGFDASAIELPDWLDREDWESWVADRKARKKPVTEEGAKRQLQQLAGYLAEGHQPRAVIAHSIAGSYQGLFPPRTTNRTTPNGASAHGNFAQQDYHAGVAADGTF